MPVAKFITLKKPFNLLNFRILNLLAVKNDALDFAYDWQQSQADIGLFEISSAAQNELMLLCSEL